MNPDAFIPFYGNDFNQAIEGQPDYIGLGYWRAIWYYWHVNHCRGLKDDQDFLRRLVRADKEQWPDAMAFIFDNEKQFTLGEDHLWHQTRAIHEWEKVKGIYTRNALRTAAATKARIANKKKGKH